VIPGVFVGDLAAGWQGGYCGHDSSPLENFSSFSKCCLPLLCSIIRQSRLKGGCIQGDDDERRALLAKLGRHKLGKGCLYIKTLKDVDVDALRALMQHSLDQLRSMYPDHT
jgi:hypothetical protein